MDLSTLSTWIEIAAGTATLTAVLIGGLWAYTKFILERSLLPPTQFTIDCETIGQQGEKTILEIVLHLRNVGTSTLIAESIRVDVRYLGESDELELFRDPDPTRSYLNGRLRFPYSLRDEVQPLKGAAVAGENVQEGRGGRGFLLLNHATFVQGGVDQLYTFITAVPQPTTFVLVWASFEYEQKPSSFQRTVLNLSRRLGLIQYDLTHVLKPHTVERAFSVAPDSNRSISGQYGKK